MSRLRPNNIFLMPDENREFLRNKSIPTIKKFTLSEEWRKHYRIRHKELASEMKLPLSTYYDYLKIHRSGNNALIDDVASDRCSVSNALSRVNEAKHKVYPLIEFYKDRDVVYQDNKSLLLRVDDGLLLHRVYPHKGIMQERKFLFDDYPFAAKILVNILETAYHGNCHIFPQMEILFPGGMKGNVRNFLLSAYFNINIGAMLNLKISEGSKELVNGAYDWRIRNMYCRELSNFPNVYKKIEFFSEAKANEFYIIRKGIVTILDNVKPLVNVVNNHQDHIYAHSRGDGRLVLAIDQHPCYLYRIVMASHIYNMYPDDEKDLLLMMEQFNADWKDFEVDHLNNVSADNRLQNLFLMTPYQNQRKEMLQRKLDSAAYRYKYFERTLRHDNNHVHFRCGTRDENFKEVVQDDCILTVDEYLEKLSEFVQKIEEKEKNNE